MFKHLLIPTDGSTLANKAVKAGIEFAREAGARVTIYQALEVHASTYYGDGYTVSKETVANLQRQHQAHAEKIFSAALKIAAAAGVTCDSFTSEESAPYEGILGAAKKRKCDVIFIASHGRGGIGSVVMGSVTQKVLAHSALPVVVYR